MPLVTHGIVCPVYNMIVLFLSGLECHNSAFSLKFMDIKMLQTIKSLNLKELKIMGFTVLHNGCLIKTTTTTEAICYAEVQHYSVPTDLQYTVQVYL